MAIKRNERYRERERERERQVNIFFTRNKKSSLIPCLRISFINFSLSLKQARIHPSIHSSLFFGTSGKRSYVQKARFCVSHPEKIHAHSKNETNALSRILWHNCDECVKRIKESTVLSHPKRSERWKKLNDFCTWNIVLALHICMYVTAAAAVEKLYTEEHPFWISKVSLALFLSTHYG